MVYEGDALLTVGDKSSPVRVKLGGRLDPIDGKYHWQGLVLAGSPPDGFEGGCEVFVTIEGRRAVGKVAEQTPWGTYGLTGTGEPPFEHNSGNPG